MDSVASTALDLKQLLRRRLPRLAPFIPSWIVGYLHKKLHVDALNEIIRDHVDLYGADFCEATLINHFHITHEVHGLEKLDPKGRYLLVGNHPLGGLDGVLLIQIMNRYFNHCRFVVNDLLMSIPNLKDSFVPIDKQGKSNSRAYVEALREVLVSDEQVFLFPAGLVSRKIGGVITDLSWHRSFLSFAKRSRRDIVPVAFGGHLRDCFYRMSNLRKRLGIRINMLEFLYIVNETFHLYNKHFRIYVGEPIPYNSLEGTKETQCALVRKQLYLLFENDC